MVNLLDYIITMPKENDSHERAHKLPFVISDIFAQENNSLLERFFDMSDSESDEEVEEEEENTRDSVESEAKMIEELKEVNQDESQKSLDDTSSTPSLENTNENPSTEETKVDQTNDEKVQVENSVVEAPKTIEQNSHLEETPIDDKETLQVQT